MEKKKTIEEMFDEIHKNGEEQGRLNERTRILKEIGEADLPLGVWPLIRNIITPTH